MLQCIVTVSVFVCVGALNTKLAENGRHLYQDIEEIEIETHQVTTSDLYILTIFRLRREEERDVRKNQYPVLLFHGLMESSDRFIEHGRNLSLAYELADAGFDVWLGNNRGNKYARHHAYLDPDDPEDKFKFFNFTYKDIGVNDVPAIVDYILEETKTKKLHYIGHSQGGTVFFALNSMRPEYNEKFLTANLLAGAGYQKHFSNPLLEILSSLEETIYAFLLQLGFVEVFPFESLIPLSRSYTVDDLVNNCLSPNDFQNLCQMLHHSKVLGTQGIDVKAKWFAGGGAVKEMVLFGQNIRLKRFCRWDYGERNEEVYGTKKPPKYDLGLITVNTTLHFGMGDTLVNHKDVVAMANDMPNVRTRKVARDDFGHSDFTDAFDAKELVYDYIIEALLYFEGDIKPQIKEKISPVFLLIKNTSNSFIKNKSNFFASNQSDSPITLISSFTSSFQYPSSLHDLRSNSRNISDSSNPGFFPRNVSNSVNANIPDSLSTIFSEIPHSDVLDSLTTKVLVSSSTKLLNSSTTNTIPNSTQVDLNSSVTNNSDNSYKYHFSPITVSDTSTKNYINTTLLITALLTVKIV